MSRVRRKIGKWSLRSFLLLVAVAGTYVAILAYPRPLFAYHERYGEYSVYSDKPLGGQLEVAIASVRTRVAAMEHGDPGAGCRVFICSKQTLYSLFTNLARRGSNSLAMGLYVFRNVYVNETKVARNAAGNNAGIRHSRYEGNLAEVIAHEIAHFNVVKELGFRKWFAQPMWKSEGYAEYQANLAATRADEGYDFAGRIDLLMDDSVWGRGSSLARRLFEAHLLVEFLAEERGFTLQKLSEADVTEQYARREMLAWYEKYVD